MAGLTAAKTHHPDLILCDVNMAGMDGRTMLKTLKEDPVCASIPFVFLTGNASMSDRRQGMQLGADDYLTKPFTSEELITVIETRIVKKTVLQKYYQSQFEDIKISMLRSLPHEFRTPLSSILGYGQILQEDDDLTAAQVKEIGDLISKSGERLHHLLDNMALFAEMQFWMNDQEKIDKLRRGSPSALLEVVESVAQNQMKMCKRTDAIRISVTNSIVLISSTHLTKILDELINNALKFSAAGTRVNISSRDDDVYVYIILHDQGRGMSPEQVARISAFQQFDRPRYEQQGAGLGLVIAKILADVYGGNLSIVSSEKGGTSVTLGLRKFVRE
jgi:signal transduction histidine kinase